MEGPWGLTRVKGWLLLCISICSTIASANRFSSRVVRRLLLCGSVSLGHMLAFALKGRPSPVWLKMQTHANAGGNAEETPLHECI